MQARHQKRPGSKARWKCHICKAGHRIEDCRWFGIWPQAGVDEMGPQARLWNGQLTAERVIDKIGVIESIADDGTPTRTLCPRQALVGPALRRMFDQRMPGTVEFCCRVKYCDPYPQGTLAAFAAWLPGNFTEAARAMGSSIIQQHAGAANAAALAMNYTAPGARPVLHQQPPPPHAHYAPPPYGYGHSYAQPPQLFYPPPPPPLFPPPPPPLFYMPPPHFVYPQQQPQFGYREPVGVQKAQLQRTVHVAMPPAVLPNQPRVLVRPLQREHRRVTVAQQHDASSSKASSSSRPTADAGASQRHAASSSQARSPSPSSPPPPPKRARKQLSEWWSS